MSMSWILVNVSKREYFEPGQIGLNISDTGSGWFANGFISLIHRLLIARKDEYHNGNFKDSGRRDVDFLGRWHGCVIVTSADTAKHDVIHTSVDDIESFTSTVGWRPGNYNSLAHDRYLDISGIIYESLKNFDTLDKILERLQIKKFNRLNRDEP